MRTMSDYKFNVSLSADAYYNKEISGAMIGTTKDENNRIIRKKYGYKANQGIGYKEVEVTPEKLLDSLINGCVFCHLFTPETIRKDGTFGSSQKKDNNFRGSYCIGVDIDETGYKTISDYINALEYKPTFYYSSYSNKPEKPKFRMVYVFDELIQNKYLFRYCAWQLNSKIEKDTSEKIADDCNLRCSQYFNGTNINNPNLTVEFGITNNVYSLIDFNITESGFIHFLREDCYYKSKSKDRDIEIDNILSIYNTSYNTYSSNTSTTYYNDFEKCGAPSYTYYEPITEVNSTPCEATKFYIDSTLVSDMSRLEYDEFMKYNRHKYQYFYRVDNYDWVKCDGYEYAVIDDRYFSLYWNVNTIKDGSKRRKKVFERMCLRRVMKPEVTPEELAFNAYEDIARFVDNSDGVLNTDYIIKNVEHAFNFTISEIEETYSDNIAYLKSKAPKKGKIYKFKGLSVSDRNSYVKNASITEVMSYYDTSISVHDNLVALNSFGINISQQTLYNYLGELGVDTKEALVEKRTNKLEMIKSLITPKNCSTRKFRKVLDENHISLSNKDLRLLLKEYKSSSI